MKTTTFAAVALSLVAATAAHAQSEGNGEPFPFRAPAMAAAAPSTYAADVGSAAFPDLSGRPSHKVIASNPDALPMNGSEGAVQTANSLPRGAMDGTVAYAQAQVLRRYLAQQEAAPTRIAGTAPRRSGEHGG